MMKTRARRPVGTARWVLAVTSAAAIQSSVAISPIPFAPMTWANAPMPTTTTVMKISTSTGKTSCPKLTAISLDRSNFRDWSSGLLATVGFQQRGGSHRPRCVS